MNDVVGKCAKVCASSRLVRVTVMRLLKLNWASTVGGVGNADDSEGGM
jgi:hypothetical protein